MYSATYTYDVTLPEESSLSDLKEVLEYLCCFAKVSLDNFPIIKVTQTIEENPKRPERGLSSFYPNAFAFDYSVALEQAEIDRFVGAYRGEISNWVSYREGN